MSIELVDGFLDYLRLERNFSDHTLRGYSNDLLQYCSYLSLTSPHDPLGLGQSMPTLDELAEVTEFDSSAITERILKIEPVELRAYLAFLSASGYSKSTTARKLASLRSLYKYCVRMGKLEASPVSVIRTPKQDRKLPKCLDVSQIEDLLNAADTSDILGCRDKAILETIYSAGLRISELVGLNIEDLREFDQAVRVKGKGKKERLAMLGSKAIEAINDYMQMRRVAFGKSESGPLFLNRHGKRISDRSIRRKLEKYIAIAGLGEHVSPHTLRHSFATHMLNAGADLRSVQEMLGHENLSTTQIYTHLTTDKLKDVYRKAHPLSAAGV